MESSRDLDHKIWGIAWPAILSNISIPLLGLVDAAILGHLGSTVFLGAVAIGAALLSFLYWGFSFLRMGTTGLVARASGSRNHELGLLILARSAVLALALALLVLALHPLLLQLGFTLMSPRPELLSLAESYAGIRIFSAPAVLLNYAIIGWFIGRQNTRWPMLIVVTTNLANILLDFVFIIGLEMNSDGAALATVLAEYLGCGLAIVAVSRCRISLPAGLWRELGSWSGYRTLLRSNRHLFIRTMLLLSSFAFFTAMGERLGSDVLAANALLMQLVLLAAYGMDGFAFAAEGLCGQRLGAGDLEGFYRAVRRCGRWCFLAGGTMSLLFIMFHGPVFQLLTSLPEVRQLLDTYLPWLVILPLVAAPSYLLDGVFIGSAETRYMMITMIFSVLVVYLPLWWLSRPWGNHGLWLAFIAFNAARGCSLYLCYLRLNRRAAWLRPAPVHR
jgi:MATE family multidrug resistance protein